MPKTKEKVSEAAGNVRPYIERAVRDEELRENVKSAFESARAIYNELMGPRGMVPIATRVATDRDIQDTLRTAVEDLRKASDRFRGREDHTARNTMLLVTGIALGILFNPITGPQTRKWVSDKLFGPADDFTYQGSSGTTSNSSSSS
jgi:hypothetical protein